MRIARFALAITALLSSPLAAQDAVFDSYEAMRAEMDTLLMQREIQDLMLRFGGGDEMTPQQLDSLDAQVEQIYPENLANKATIKRIDHANGFSQELIAYWSGLRYVYAYVFYHMRDGKAVAINYRFNSNFAELNGLF